MTVILDTNVLSELRKSACSPSVRAWADTQATDGLFISAITVLAIQHGITLLDLRGDAAQAQVFARWLDELVLPAFERRILPVDHIVARRAARLRWPDGKDCRDPLIAATALVHDAVVVQRQLLWPVGVNQIGRSPSNRPAGLMAWWTPPLRCG